MEYIPADELIDSLPSTRIVGRAMEVSQNKIRLINPRPNKSPYGNKDPFESVHENGRRVHYNSNSFTDAVVSNLAKRNKFIEAAFKRINESDDAEDVKDKPQVKERKKSENKMIAITKEELFFLVKMFKEELDQKNAALNCMKFEQLKRLMIPVEINNASIADAYYRLQAKLKRSKDTNNNDVIANSKNSTNEPKTTSNQVSKQETDQRLKLDDTEKLHTLDLILELLEKHPMLAFPRDSLYCFDYNFDESSTKNLLNSKLYNIENMVRQHKAYRVFMNKRLRECERSLFNLSQELEMEKNNRNHRVEMMLKNKDKSILERSVEQAANALEEEKRTKLLIVMTLLGELNDERDKIRLLVQENSNLKEKNAQLVDKLANDKSEYENLIKELALENSSLKMKLERRGSTTNLVKPQVPAKPALLLDQKQNSLPNSKV